MICLITIHGVVNLSVVRNQGADPGVKEVEVGGLRVKEVEQEVEEKEEGRGMELVRASRTGRVKMQEQREDRLEVHQHNSDLFSTFVLFYLFDLL